MSAYYVGSIHIRDVVQWEIYLSQVGATITQYGGEVLLRGVSHEDAERAQRIVVLCFADAAAALRWHQSPAYQALIPIRDAAADVRLVLYQQA